MWQAPEVEHSPALAFLHPDHQGDAEAELVRVLAPSRLSAGMDGD